MATSNVDRSHGPEAPSGASGPSLARVRAVGNPSAELLERALDGWERFLDTFEGVSDE